MDELETGSQRRGTVLDARARPRRATLGAIRNVSGGNCGNLRPDVRVLFEWFDGSARSRKLGLTLLYGRGDIVGYLESATVI